MKCAKCNHTLPEDSEFCQYCGAQVVKTVAPIVAESSSTPSLAQSPAPKAAERYIPQLSELENMSQEETFATLLKFQAQTTVETMNANRESQPNHEGAADFGLVPEKPIFTLALKSVDGEKEYLGRLYTSNGEKIKYNRRGSMSANGINGMIDIYDTYLPSGQLYKTIYINMYGAKCSLSAPSGFSFEPIQKLKCPKCNHPLPIDSEFCQFCGTSCAKPTTATVSTTSTVATNPPIEAKPTPQPLSNYTFDSNLGLVPNNPIYTCGTEQQQSYLLCLRSLSGEVLRWNYRGSTSIDGICGSVSIYDAYLPSGLEYKTIYLNSSGMSYPTYAPKGFSYTSVSPLNHNQKQSQKNSHAPKRSKTAKILITLGIIIILLAICIPIGLQEYHYQLAQQHFDSKDYDVAYAEFEGLGDYRDSESMLETILSIKYKNLQQAMLSIDGSNYKTIGSQIDELPFDYRDISTIKSQYNQIKKNIDIIQSTKAYSSSITLTEKSCDSLRIAYANLSNFNAKNSNWDLGSYLESTRDKYLLNLVFGIQWKTSNGTTFYWHEGDGGKEKLQTGLSNKKSPLNEYLFYISLPNKFGYKNKNNSQDFFIAYKISNIVYSGGKWRIKIYCYSTSQTVSLDGP